MDPKIKRVLVNLVRNAGMAGEYHPGWRQNLPIGQTDNRKIIATLTIQIPQAVELGLHVGNEPGNRLTPTPRRLTVFSFGKETGLHRVAHKICNRVQVELGHQPLPVRFDRFRADVALTRDGLATQSGCNQFQYFSLPG